MPRGASWALVHDVHGLNVKSISHLYLESRSLTLSNIRFFSDARVKHALDSKEEREVTWRRKFSSAAYAKGLLEEVVAPIADPVTHLTTGNNLDDSLSSWSSLELEDVPAPSLPAVPPLPITLPTQSLSASSPIAPSSPHLPPPPPPSPPVALAPLPNPPVSELTRKTLKRKVQKGIQDRVNDFWKEKIGRYVMQGDYLALLMEENNCISWKSFMWDVPQGVLKFALNAGLNTLPTSDNLKRWGKRASDRCSFCGNTETLAHVLSNCNTALTQGRLTWRHNSVLSSILRLIQPHLKNGMTLYSDIPGYQAPHGGTIPPHILTTTLKPDVFIFSEVSEEVIIFELTCPWDSNIERSHTFKTEKYAPLVSDLSGHRIVSFFAVEVSARGQVSKSNQSRLKSFVFKCCDNPRILSKTLFRVASKAALLSSFSLFAARREPSWEDPAPLTVAS